MQTIETKFYGPTNHKGSRIRAKSAGGVIHWYSYDYALNSSENHCAAAKELKDKLEWRFKMHGGDTKDGMVFVFPDVYTID